MYVKLFSYKLTNHY